MIKLGIEIAKNSVKIVNSDLKSLLTKGTLDRDAITKAHQKISMGVKRKSELEVSLQEVKKLIEFIYFRNCLFALWFWSSFFYFLSFEKHVSYLLWNILILLGLFRVVSVIESDHGCWQSTFICFWKFNSSFSSFNCSSFNI